MLFCTLRIRSRTMTETVCECSDTGADIVIPFDPGLVCCLRPIYCLLCLSSRLVDTEILYYNVVHVRVFGSGDKMNPMIASPYLFISSRAPSKSSKRCLFVASVCCRKRNMLQGLHMCYLSRELHQGIQLQGRPGRVFHGQVS